VSNALAIAAPIITEIIAIATRVFRLLSDFLKIRNSILSPESIVTEYFIHKKKTLMF